MAAEKNFERRIKKYLEVQGIYALGTPRQNMQSVPVGYYEKRWGNRMTASGLPDLHIIINGKSIEVEIKAPNGRTNELQKHVINQINLSGCKGFVLYEHEEDIPDDDFGFYVDYQEFKRLIRGTIDASVA